MKTNLVTIVIPVFNQEKYVERAIESALDQICEAREILVIDDGSTDGTASLIEAYKPFITVVRQENAGTSAAWNLAIKLAKTNYLIGLDSDDEFLPTTVQKTMQLALDNPDADVIYSDYEFIDGDGERFKVVKNPEPFDPVGQLISLHDRLGQPDNFLPFGHVRLYRKEALLKIGGYDETYINAEDYELVLRLAEHRMKFMHVPEVLYRYRWHTSNKGVVARAGQKNEVKRSVAEYKERLAA